KSDNKRGKLKSFMDYRTVRFETQPGYHLSATPGKKLIWWLPDNSAPGLTAASLNHAEYQRRALPVKRET
ncbi:hypothetical protein, partial [Escherichia coli]|uniref:hypothetical protein n=2 Tax=Escherichia coli TaxID=562 RepID=UPI003C7242D6